MEQEPRSITRDDLHATYVEQSIKELQRMIQNREDALTELRSTARAVPVPTAAASLEIIAAAYEDAAQTEPFLPFPDSVLPALLALRKTHQVLAESQTYVASQGTPSLDKARKQLIMDKARLEGQKALEKALEARRAALRAGLETRRHMTVAQRRQEALDALRAKKRDYDRETSVLLRALKTFIQTRLGPMLAAEALGGPVVGGLVDIQADDLAAGFSAQGKLKKPSSQNNKADNQGRDNDRRQRRIDEIWGPRRHQTRGGGEDDDDNDDDHDDDDDEEEDDSSNGHPQDEASAASTELQELTEELLNALADAGGDSSLAYVVVPRESAAARFLVRSKVAQFHPKDAMRLRLVDFGRELDD
ncbi:hypothetical protein SPI_00297 [Niveomyces insectorum RCEF 264]|uniref:Centromere protein Cenp-K n=1 Tax=Niveomyces insectorum RCEF 264 TaxID=1081102 RepID=A0A162JFE3_9HYPO|nr:hypothetical protein SPI_00297 [Niveomyces insectorum RCEF 264]